MCTPFVRFPFTRQLHSNYRVSGALPHGLHSFSDGEMELPVSINGEQYSQRNQLRMDNVYLKQTVN